MVIIIAGWIRGFIQTLVSSFVKFKKVWFLYLMAYFLGYLIPCYIVIYSISQFPPTRFLLITAIRMSHFLPVHHLEWHFWPGRRSKYNNQSQHQLFGLICFIWASFFNIMSTFVGYLILKPSVLKNSSSTEGDKRVHAFPNGISPKVNIMARLAFELVYYDVTV